MNHSFFVRFVLCCFALLAISTTTTFAQKDKGNNSTTVKNNTNGNSGKETGKGGNTTDKTDKGDKKAQPASAKSNNAVSDKVLANLAELSREEKNTMTTCPMHGVRMNLSDNYRANASDYRQSAEFPFAYQLNYRRSCPKCTQALEAQDKAIAAADKRDANEATFERCPKHNEAMFINGEQRTATYEKDPDEDSPYADTYGFKYYCKTCNKVYKIAHKNDDKEE